MMESGKGIDEIRDYSLVGKESELSLERGLAEATWYTSPVPREKMRALLVRRNGPAIRDTLLWFGLIFGSAFLVILLWGTWWFLIPYIVYAVLYSSTSDSRWHESSHGTAFRSNWMNNVLYEIASFMVLRQSTVWRWSHTRHHSDTLIRGRDPEIAAPRPPNIPGILMNFFALRSGPAEFKKIVIHATGRIDREVATYLPTSEYVKVIWKARIYLFIFASAITLSILYSTLLPVMFIGLPTLVGTWLMPVYGLTQHAGLAENVLDHRLNCRTVYMNRIHRFLYWNMNYHIEHHMFPMVPYHALPKLHELIKNDCPPPYKSIAGAFREIIPTLRKQVKDPTYFAERILPSNSSARESTSYKFRCSIKDADENGNIRICSSEDIPAGEVVRLDMEDHTYAIYRTRSGQISATDGICTHGNTHLSEGLIIGDQIECPKHNGRFTIRDGSPQRLPVCDGLRTYKVQERGEAVYIDLKSVEEAEAAEKRFEFKVISNDNVATFIKELVLEPGEEMNDITFRPGEYLKLDIPAHKTSFSSFVIDEPFDVRWREQNLFHYYCFNAIRSKRNYSMANNPGQEDLFRFNVRIALPPLGINCYAGVGSSYVFDLKPGDTVFATGPFGDFHIRETERDMVYVGGGAGMAPLRSHIAHLFESKNTSRKVTYWYGSRSKSELYYTGYFRHLAKNHTNFSFHVALSEPLKSDRWDSHTGFIHEVLKREYLEKAEDPESKEYYICGPPEMVKAVGEVLAQFKVPEDQIAFDEF